MEALQYVNNIVFEGAFEYLCWDSYSNSGNAQSDWDEFVRDLNNTGKFQASFRGRGYGIRSRISVMKIEKLH